MNDIRNTILAIFLSVSVLFAWEYFYGASSRQTQQQTPSAQDGQAVIADIPVGGAPGQPAQPSSQLAGDPVRLPQVPLGPEAVQDARENGHEAGQAATIRESRIPIENAQIVGSINLVGGRIDDVKLKEYRTEVDPDSPMIHLLRPVGEREAYFADYGWIAANSASRNVTLPGPQTQWQVEGNGALGPQSPVQLYWDNGEGLIFRKSIAIDNDFLFTISLSVENRGGKPLQLHPYGLVSRTGTPQTAGFFILHEGLIGFFGDSGSEEIDYDDLVDEKRIGFGDHQSGWLGITDKYWATALIPVPGSSFRPSFSYHGDSDNYQAEYLGAAQEIGAGASADFSGYLFAGAKQVSLIDSYERDLNIEKFDLLIDWGWFYFLTKPTFHLIDILFRQVGNFGIAILLVTILIKAVFFPLANKSYVSMSRMKLVQPEMVKIRDRYKDDKQKQQKALIELYKKEKINPLSGCVPIALQIPVFFALYKVLFVTIEMRHAPFFGWIHDLSAADPTTIFNLFGLIPWAPPTLLMLGVWPLVMGLTMFVQMKMNPTPTDPTQAMIFNWMPVIFTIMLASFPAGLVIYWAWNNFLSILQQYVIMRRQGVKVELWDNLLRLVKVKKSTEG